MKNKFLLSTTVILLLTIAACNKSNRDCVNCGKRQPYIPPTTEPAIDTVRVHIVINDTTIVNNTTTGGTTTTTTTTTTGTNTGGGGTPPRTNGPGIDGTWYIDGSNLGLMSSTWMEWVGVTGIAYTGSCYQKQGTTTTLHLSKETWMALHDNTITNYATGIVVSIPATDPNGYSIVAVNRYITANNFCY